MQRPASELSAVGFLSEVDRDCCQVSEACGGVRMVGTKGFLIDGDGAPQEGRGLRDITEQRVRQPEVAEPCGGVGMLGAEGLLVDCEGALQERYGLRGLPERAMHLG